MQEDRQVKFDRGRVSAYNGQTDLYCDFVTVTQGGKQEVYYILNDKKLNNGFYIASTVLKEAIDPQIFRTHLGVINQKGDIVISFENKSIKTVEDKYLLVVRSDAKTKSVIDAIASRNDPASAEKMVNANASIKDKLNRIMDAQENEINSKFILNDLLSEGTVYTLDGQNIFNNQYYSFIGMTPDAFYCSTNVVDDKVVKVPRSDVFRNAPVIDPAPASIPLEEAVEKKEVLDVSTISVEKEKIDQALESSGQKVVEEVKTVDANTDDISSNVSDNKEVSSLDDVELPPISIDKPLETFSIPEVKTDSIFGNLPKVDDVKEEPADAVKEEKLADTTSFDNDSSEMDENIIDVVQAVDNVVHENKRLKTDLEGFRTDNERLRADNEKLQAELRNKEYQLTRLPQIEEENQRLVSLVNELKDQNARMQDGIRQMRDVLSIPTNNQEPVTYQRVA